MPKKRIRSPHENDYRRSDNPQRRHGTALTPEAAKTICDAIRSGLGNESAANLAGVAERNIYYWMNRGRVEKRGRYKEFHDAYRQAQADSIVPLIRTARKVAIGGVYWIPSYDENGDVMLDKDGKPIINKHVLLPNGELALKLAAKRSPRDWGDQAGTPPEDELMPTKPGQLISLFQTTINLMLNYGITVPEGLVERVTPPPDDAIEVPSQGLNSPNDAEEKAPPAADPPLSSKRRLLKPPPVTAAESAAVEKAVDKPKYDDPPF